MNPKFVSNSSKSRIHLSRFLTILATLMLLSCTSSKFNSDPDPESVTGKVDKSSLTQASAWITPDAALTVMTFNVENLFDTKDEPRKNDETFLPLSLKNSVQHKKLCEAYKQAKWRQECLSFDWSDQILKTKLSRLGEVLKSGRVDAKEGAKGPDLLFLQEVENLAILERLLREQTPDLGLNAYLIEGRDKRGIDVAIVSRLPLVGRPKLHQIPFKKISSERLGDTRGILEVGFRLPTGRTLTAFAVHFPAPFHPRIYREQAFEFLNQLQARAQKKGHLTVAGGDFNITLEETNSSHILDRLAQPSWIISHNLGCGGCRGTNYYAPKQSWSFLDMILLDKSFYEGTLGWKASEHSVRIVNYGSSEQIDSSGAPKAFDPSSGLGVSDHWPVALDIIPEDGR